MRRVAPLLTALILFSNLSEVLAQQKIVKPEVLEVYESRTFQDMPYRLMKPIDLADHPERAYPLVLSLHGGKGRGTDNVKNLESWTRVMADEEWRRAYPSIVVAPQAQGRWLEPGMVPELTEKEIKGFPEAYRDFFTQHWTDLETDLETLRENQELAAVFGLLDELAHEFNIDTDRVYVLGHSMGGMGVWNALHQQPQRFAAGITTAGGFLPWLDAGRIRDVPVWCFHGSSDDLVPVELSRLIFEELKSLGGNAKYTELVGMPHNIEAAAFLYDGDDPDQGYVTQYSGDRCDRTPNVWDWLFAQKRQ